MSGMSGDVLCRVKGHSSDGLAGEKVYGVHLRAPYQLRSADDLQYPFSNYVRGYTGLLDYVWYEPDRLDVQVSLQFASHPKQHEACQPDEVSRYSCAVDARLHSVALPCAEHVQTAIHPLLSPHMLVVPADLTGLMCSVHGLAAEDVGDMAQRCSADRVCVFSGAIAHTFGGGAAGLDPLSEVPI